MSQPRDGSREAPCSADGGLDWEASELDDGTWEVWTPDFCGACIGSGPTREAAIKNMSRTMLATVSEVIDPPNREVSEAADRKNKMAAGDQDYRTGMATGRPESEAAFAAPKCSATCCLCKWTNVSLLNLGEPGEPRWTCHGCCKRMLDTLEKLRDGDFAGTPINRGSSAMMLIQETLSPNQEISGGGPLSNQREKSGSPPSAGSKC